MFYVIETEYVGPNQDSDEYLDVNTIEIRGAPGVTGGVIDGWVERELGEHETIDAARAAIEVKFGPVREIEIEDEDEDGVIEIYKPGRYEPMGRNATAGWAFCDIRTDISADTTDRQIAELVEEYDDVAKRDHGLELDLYHLAQLMTGRRADMVSDHADAV